MSVTGASIHTSFNFYAVVQLDSTELSFMEENPARTLELDRLVRPATVTETKAIAKLAPDLSAPYVSSQEVFWDNDEDPANPMNWSGKKKWTQILLVTLLTFVT